MDDTPGSSKLHSEASEDVVKIRLSNINDDNQEKGLSCSEVTDNAKIACTNMRSITEIMDIVTQQISQFADSSDLGDEKEQFVSRFMSVFKDAIQANITINDFPCIFDKNALTSEQKQDQSIIINDTLATKLSENIATVAKKRKYSPQDCCRILEMKLKQDRQNLKKLKVEAPPSMLPPSVFKMDTISADKFRCFAKSFAVIQKTIKTNADEIKRIKNNIAFATNIVSQKKSSITNTSMSESKDI